MTVTLRQATGDDVEFLYALHRLALGDVIEAIWGPWNDRQQRQFHGAWFQPAKLLVVVCEGQDVGVLEAQHGAEEVYLARIELLPEFQGRGIGTRLIKELIQRARRSGANAVELDVLEANERARRLYERLGFTVIAGTPPKQRMRLSFVSPDLTARARGQV